MKTEVMRSHFDCLLSGLPDGVVVAPVRRRLLDELVIVGRGRGVAADKDGDVSVGRRLD